MKTKADYDILLNLHERIKNDSQEIILTKPEQDALKIILEDIQGDYIPTALQMDRQKMNIKHLQSIDYEKDPRRWESVMSKCREFENQFC